MAFDFEIPDTSERKGLSGLDDEAKRALAGAAFGSNPADMIAETEELPIETELRHNVRRWAEDEFASAFDSWERYGLELGTTVPADLHEFMEQGHWPVEKLERLYDALTVLQKSRYKAVNGRPIAETMHLVAIPWRAMKDIYDRRENFPLWFARCMRDVHDMSPYAVGFYHALEHSLVFGDPCYRAIEGGRELMTPSEYLQHKLDRDGDWGVMLMQTAGTPGLKHVYYSADSSPDILTRGGADRFRLHGHPSLAVDRMGVFELAAYMLQCQNGVKSLGRDGQSFWLLGNRYSHDGIDEVPYVTIGNSTIDVQMYKAGADMFDGRFRLAVA